MKILFAADGSKYTKKALAFLVTHEGLAGPQDEVIVLNVQPALSPRVTAMAGAAQVRAYHKEESGKVLEPISRFLARHRIAHQCIASVGSAPAGILKAAASHKAYMIVMGTHGHGLLGRALMGSVAQRVVAEAGVPVLLVQ